MLLCLLLVDLLAAAPAAGTGPTSEDLPGAIAFLQKAKEQKIEPREEARINYLISEYGGEFTIPPAGSTEEEFIWNKLQKEKQTQKNFASDYEKWKTQSK